MAIKKSELYSKIWAGCDELRGSMDPSQYKDYVLWLLFIRYISDKYAGKKYGAIVIPDGASFKDLVELKGSPQIGDDINKKIVGPIAAANRLTDTPDFNDDGKMGAGKEKVDKLTSLIAIFENRDLDFSKNRADGDDILGDAYEYLMRKFATDSGKSKGQFYTPAEVSRVIAQITGIRTTNPSTQTTVYDPTCGSGSLLLKVADEAGVDVTIYGQEKDGATSGLARMNVILHNNPNAQILQGNTLTTPRYTDKNVNGVEGLKLFDYVVANPPFSDKRWINGLDPLNDAYNRFQPFGEPPHKQGDYAYLLHIVASLRSTGVGMCVLPHGVLFRGNAEAAIREKLIRKGYIAGIIGLPANLFYGTGIPACIVVIDKKNATNRQGVFMIDASAGFMKDGPKNRLRAQDIHKIVDAFNRKIDIPRYSRMVSVAEIKKNDFNLNLPRYIDSQMPEDLQDIAGHLRGGIPISDIDALSRYWAVCPTLRSALFKPNRAGYVDLAVPTDDIRSTIYEHPEFTAFIADMTKHFVMWRDKSAKSLKGLQPQFHPKDVISRLAEDLLAHYIKNPLIDPYSVYQHLMDYWDETMQDDCYFIASDGWKAEPSRVIEVNKKTGKEKDKGWVCDLIPKQYIVARYFAKKQHDVDALTANVENLAAKMTALEEEHNVDGGFLEFEPINKANVSARVREIAGDTESLDETEILKSWVKLNSDQTDAKRKLSTAEAELDALAHAKYATLAESEIKNLVVDDKWLTSMSIAVHGELDQVSQQLAKRTRELAERYGTPGPETAALAVALGAKVDAHLKKMGFSWI